jgi:hypothetical protein
MVCKEDHFTKDFPCLSKVHQYLERWVSPSLPMVLTNPLPQQQQMISQIPMPHLGEIQSPHPQIL